MQGALEHPAQLELGDLAVGSTLKTTLPLKNVGSIVIRIQEIQVEAPQSLSLSVEAESLELLPGRTTELGFSVLPLQSSEQPDSAWITFRTNLDEAPRRIRVDVRGVEWLELRPAVVDFGNVHVGGVRTVEVLAINRSGAPIDLMVPSDAFGEAAFETNSPGGTFHAEREGAPGLIRAQLPPHQGHPIRIRYAPDSAGSADVARLQFFRAREPEDRIALSLAGRGVRSSLECTPQSIDLGEVPAGQLRVGRVTCTNTSGRTIELQAAQLTEQTDPAYELLEPQSLPLNLEGGARFDVVVRLTPTPNTPIAQPLPGEVLLDFRLLDPNASRLPSVGIPLFASLSGPDLQLIPGQIDMGRVQLGYQSSANLGLQNAGNALLNIHRVTVEGEGFSIGPPPIGVVPGGLELIEVRYEPTALGAAQGQLRIESNDPDRPVRIVPLSAQALELGPCSYSLTPGQMNFGVVPVLHSRTAAVLIENRGAEDCLLRDPAIEGDGAEAFSLIDPPNPDALLPPGGRALLRVAYQPRAPQEHRARLRFWISQPGNPTPAVPLFGAAGSPRVLVTPNELDFGAVQPGCRSPTRTFELLNVGEEDVSLTELRFSGSATSSFSLPIPALPLVLAPGEKSTVEVRFTPQTLGLHLGLINLVTQAPGVLEEHLISLRGDGQQSPNNEDRFEQASSGKTDVLFVIDNSLSMAEEQMRLISNIEHFIALFEALDFDYQLAVLSTDMSTGGSPCFLPAAQRPPNTPEGACGYFAQGSGGLFDPDWRLITPDDLPSPPEAFTTIAQVGVTGSAVEAGLESAYRALSPPLINGWNQGFLRTDAQLGLLFISDEDDQSHRSTDFYTSFFKGLKGAGRSHLLGAAGIVADEEGCMVSAGASTRYIELVQALGGEIESICTQDWEATLSAVARWTAGLRHRFNLSNQALPGTITVEIDGVELPAQSASGEEAWRYDPANNELIFSTDSIPPAGAQISVGYQPGCF